MKLFSKSFFWVLSLSTILLFFFNRGFLYHDEGYILHAVQRFISGEIPYKDFDFIYAPGILLVLFPFLKIFGENIITGRIITLIVQIISVGAVYELTKKVSRNNLLAVLSAIVFLIFGPGHLNFPWPVVFALPTGILSIIFFLKENLFLSGVFTFLVFIFKQNFGIGVMMAIFVYFLLFEKNNYRHWKKFIIGISLSAALFFIFLLTSGSLNSFLKYFFFVVKEIIFKKALTTDFPGLGDISFWGVGKLFFYVFPGLVSFMAMLVSHKKDREGFLLSAFTFFFYIFGIRPTTDYTHLAYLMALVGMPLSVIAKNLKYKSINVLTTTIIILVFLFGLGIYSILFRNYYRWESPIFNHRYFIDQPKMGIMVNQKYKIAIPLLQEEVDRYTKKNDYIFSFYRAPLFYFIFDRKNPTRYIHIDPSLDDKGIQMEVIKNLKDKKVRLIITHDFPPGGNKILVNYIKNNFKVVKNILEFNIWIIF